MLSAILQVSEKDFILPRLSELVLSLTPFLSNEDLQG